MHNTLPVPLWPRTLIRTNGQPKLIYLDLKDWISFAQVLTKHPKGDQYRELFQVCCNAVQNKNALFPFSQFTIMELQNNSFRHRSDLTIVVEQLSEFKTVCPPTVIIEHEFETVLDCLVGPRPKAIPIVNYLGYGIFHAAGLPFHPMEHDPYWTRKIVCGPNPIEEVDARQGGWNPKELLKGYEINAQNEQQQVTVFKDNLPPKGHKFRDEWRRFAIAGRAYVAEIDTIVTRCCDARGTSLEIVFDPDTGWGDLRNATDAMPWLDCFVSLLSSLHRDPNYLWNRNTIIDIQTLAITIPYCDVVLTDHAMMDHAFRCNLPKRYGTVVISDLHKLNEFLL
ncbi:MAG: hypothetical protein F4Y80_01100 [Caldilineaceae bacterium SB0665_bin_21]|nr:hypothetical protein [Caldilineaceae bacterium SB0665_bin_21]